MGLIAVVVAILKIFISALFMGYDFEKISFFVTSVAEKAVDAISSKVMRRRKHKRLIDFVVDEPPLPGPIDVVFYCHPSEWQRPLSSPEARNNLITKVGETYVCCCELRSV